MSVESARKGVHKWCDVDDAKRRDSRQALDTLILEVQAAMPCYEEHQEFYENGLFFQDRCTVTRRQNLCPSCAAREQLAAMSFDGRRKR